MLRYGEQIIGNLPDEQGQDQPISVIEYIAASLIQDELTLATPIHKTILDLAVEHVHDEGFMAEKFFLNYPDPAINALTFDLVTDKEQLSRMHQKQSTQYTEKENPLPSMTEHILTDYKIEIVNKESKQILRELQGPDPLQGDQGDTKKALPTTRWESYRIGYFA